MLPYKAQLDAIKAALETHSGTISMPTGTGKSMAIALLINSLQVKTLVVVPNLGLKYQLQETFKSLFGSLDNITIENIDSPRLPQEKNYDLLIVDEAHHAAASTYRRLSQKAWGGIYYRYFFTATPFRGKSEEQILLESITGEVIYKLSYHDALAQSMIVPVEAYYIESPKLVTGAYTWAEVYSQLVTKNVHRNALLATLMHSLWSTGQSALCLVKEIAHGENIKALMPGSYARFANGKDEDTPRLIKDFNRGSGGSLIGTTGIIGEGVDTKPAEWIIIAGLGKSRTQFMQQVGRGVRRYPGKESCKIILVKDSSHKFTLNHFREQCKILKEEYGVIPAKLDLRLSG